MNIRPISDPPYGRGQYFRLTDPIGRKPDEAAASSDGRHTAFIRIRDRVQG